MKSLCKATEGGRRLRARDDAAAAAILAVAEGNTARRNGNVPSLPWDRGVMSRFHQHSALGIGWRGLSRIGTGWRCEKVRQKQGGSKPIIEIPIATTGAGLAGQWDPANLQAHCVVIATSIKSA